MDKATQISNIISKSGLSWQKCSELVGMAPSLLRYYRRRKDPIVANRLSQAVRQHLDQISTDLALLAQLR